MRVFRARDQYGRAQRNLRYLDIRKRVGNGYSKKTVKTQLGEVDVKIPRDRNGEYEPQIIEKYNRNADGMERKFLRFTPVE